MFTYCNIYCNIQCNIISIFALPHLHAPVTEVHREYRCRSHDRSVRQDEDRGGVPALARPHCNLDNPVS